MKYNIRGKNIDVTESIRDYLIDKLDKLNKYSISENADAKVLISTKGINQKVEVTLKAGKYIIRAEEVNEDLYASIDLVADKLERQLKKYKNKVSDKKKRLRKISTSDEEVLDDLEEKEIIVRRKEVHLKPTNEEEAIIQMNLLDHSFFVYKDEVTNKINIVYKRNEGDYGIIEAN